MGSLVQQYIRTGSKVLIYRKDAKQVAQTKYAKFFCKTNIGFLCAYCVFAVKY